MLPVVIVVVAGIPGSGKTTLARSLAQQLGWSLMSKDVIEEALMDVLGTGSLEWVGQLSRAAHRVMYTLAPALEGSVVLEAHFHRGVAEHDLVALGEPMVQVYCRCPVDLAWERYQQRRIDPQRHAGHLPEHQDENATWQWRTTESLPLDLDAPLIEVDTTGDVDVVVLATHIIELLTDGRDSP